MKTAAAKSPEINAFIGKFPAGTRKILQKVRMTIRKAAPGAQEGMGYGVAAYKLNGRPLIYFSAFKNHVGIYPGVVAVKAFKKEFSGYGMSKGTVRFALDAPVPYGLITKIVKFRVKEDKSAAKNKQ